jgi:amino-acid N-acetyltransferase
MTDGLRLRQANVHDAETIFTLVNHYAGQAQMLPKSQNQIYQNIRDFRVIVDGQNRVIGCGALHVLWGDLAEIRSLAVAEGRRQQGLGRRIVQKLIDDARELGLPTVFALTYVPGFFESLGFQTVDKNSLPRKIWGDCIDCPKFPNCDEIAMIRAVDIRTVDAEAAAE